MSVLTLPEIVDAPAVYPGLQPLDPPRAHSSGPAPYRVLAVGGRLLAGHGVPSHDQALSGALARSLARRIGHGFDVESVIGRDAVLGAGALKRRDLSKIDALVIVLERNDITSSRAATTRIARLTDDLWQRMTPAASVTVVVPPATLSRRSDVETAGFVAALRRELSALTRVVHLTDRPLADEPAERYGRWGEAIAETVAASLIDPLVWCDAVERFDERKRQAAVRRLGALDAEWEATFDRIVRVAGRAYGARSASISIVDGDVARYLARRGSDIDAVPRGESLCDVALRTYGGVIVGDAQTDARFSRLPLVRSGAVRFYAGYRVEGPDGEPLGALCVFDSEPRSIDPDDITLLRDLALEAQRRIWELTRDRSIG